MFSVKSTTHKSTKIIFHITCHVLCSHVTINISWNLNLLQLFDEAMGSFNELSRPSPTHSFCKHYILQSDYAQDNENDTTWWEKHRPQSSCSCIAVSRIWILLASLSYLYVNVQFISNLWFVIATSFQGFFIFIFHGVGKKEFRDEWINLPIFHCQFFKSTSNNGTKRLDQVSKMHEKRINV